METQFIHPEARPGDVFFSNMTKAHFAAFSWSSKRMGAITYDGEGNKLPVSDWFPVFVHQTEIDERGRGLSAERRSFRERRLQEAA